jgi:hypothetical protein
MAAPFGFPAFEIFVAFGGSPPQAPRKAPKKRPKNSRTTHHVLGAERRIPEHGFGKGKDIGAKPPNRVSDLLA